MLPKDQVIALYTHAAIFVCPSVYEPFGIINLEAMACETPVVASAVGGIPEVVEHGETGLLVAPEAISATDVEPRHPEQFSRDLAAAVNVLLDDPALRDRDGREGAGPRRAEVFVDQHRAADARVLRGARCRPPRAKEQLRKRLRNLEALTVTAVAVEQRVRLLVVVEALRLGIEAQLMADAIGNVCQMRQRRRQVAFERCRRRAASGRRRGWRPRSSACGSLRSSSGPLPTRPARRCPILGLSRSSRRPAPGRIASCCRSRRSTASPSSRRTTRRSARRLRRWCARRVCRTRGSCRRHTHRWPSACPAFPARTQARSTRPWRRL